MQVVAGGDVSGGGDDGEEEREARHRHVRTHYVRRDLLLHVRPEKPPDSVSCTACGHRMVQRKWKETKQQPSMLSGAAVPGSCLVSFHILLAILSTSTVQPADIGWRQEMEKKPKLQPGTAGPGNMLGSC